MVLPGSTISWQDVSLVQKWHEYYGNNQQPLYDWICGLLHRKEFTHYYNLVKSHGLEGKAIDPSKESATVVLVNGHVVKMAS